MYNRTKSGNDVLLHVSTSVVRDAEGEILGFVAIARVPAPQYTEPQAITTAVEN